MIPDNPTDESIKDVLAHLCFKEGWHRYLEGELSISVYWRGRGRDSGTTFITDYESWRMLLKGKRKLQKFMFKVTGTRTGRLTCYGTHNLTAIPRGG